MINLNGEAMGALISIFGFLIMAGIGALWKASRAQLQKLDKAAGDAATAATYAKETRGEMADLASSVKAHQASDTTQFAQHGERIAGVESAVVTIKEMLTALLQGRKAEQ